MRLLMTGILLNAIAVSTASASALEQAIRGAAGTQADFVQRFTPQGFKTQQVERGTVTFGAAPQMRWSYTAPEQKVFVFDGQKSWLYSPADRQVTVTNVTDEDRRAIPFLLIADASSLDRHFMVSHRTRGNVITAHIKPRATSSPIREVTVTMDRSKLRIRTLTYVDRQGNRTTFEFSNYRKAPAGELAFRFTPPPGVDVIETQR